MGISGVATTTYNNGKWKIPFFTMWLGQQILIVGARVAQFAMIWWLTKATGSASILTTGTFIALVPGIISGPFIGALIDQWNRKIIIIFTDISIAFAFLALACLFLFKHVNVPVIFSIMFVVAVCDAFHWPSLASSTSLMVPEIQLARVAGINQSILGTANIIAPLAGAFLLNLFSLDTIMIFAAFTALLAVISIVYIRVPQPFRGVRGYKSSLLTDVMEGMKYIRQWSGLFYLICISAVSKMFVMSVFVLIPVFVTRHLMGGVLDLGFLNSTEGIGLVTGGILIGIWGGFQKRINTIVVCFLGASLGILILGVAPADHFWISAVGVFIFAFMIAACNGPFMAILQSSVAPGIQARVLTVYTSFSSVMVPLGMVIAGPVADRLGVQYWYILAGAVSFFVGALCFFIPAVMNIETIKPGK